MKLNDVSIRVKILGGFCLVALLVLFTGIGGYRAMMDIIHAGARVDAAMEMKLSVRSSMQLLMEILQADNRSELEQCWTEHQGFAATYKQFSKALAVGGETETGYLPPTDNPQSREKIDQARELYESMFLVTMEQVFTLKKAQLAGDVADDFALRMDELDRKADGAGVRSMNLLDTIETNARATMKDRVKGAVRISIIMVSLATIFSIVAGLFLSGKITGPLGEAVELAAKLAKGDLTAKTEVRGADEVGKLSFSLNEMVSQLHQMFSSIREQADQLLQTSGDLSTVGQQLVGNANETTELAHSVAAASEEMSVNMNSVAAASEEASTNVTMVASASEEMSVTISEIAVNAEKAHSIAVQAVEQAGQASNKMDALGSAATEISEVTGVITDISEQTNLLALNATIEAARAGEAGKGFAVVANEIKELAKQTAEATGEIRAKIEHIQASTTDTVDEIREVSEVIAEVNEIVSTIAGAVDQQSATTREIATNVNQAAQGISEVNENVAQSSTVSSDISRNVNQVSQSTEEVRREGEQLNQAAGNINEMARRLQAIVARFRLR